MRVHACQLYSAVHLACREHQKVLPDTMDASVQTDVIEAPPPPQQQSLTEVAEETSSESSEEVEEDPVRKARKKVGGRPL